MRVPPMVSRFWRAEEGQDLVEYTLLLAFLTLVATGIFISVGNNVSAIWTKANSRIQQANTAGQ